MECEYNHTPYKEDWTTTRGMSTSQPQHSQGSTWRKPSGQSSGVLGRLQYSAMKSLGPCQTRAHGTVHVAHFSLDLG
jgi:hypothetical protein